MKIRLPSAWPGLACVVVMFLATAEAGAVTLVRTAVSGDLNDPWDRCAEIRITVSFSVDPWMADRHLTGSDGETLIYVQAYHDPSFPPPPGMDSEHDPYHVIVRWDAFAPPGRAIGHSGSTAILSFSDFSAELDSASTLPAPAYFNFQGDLENQSMTLVWSNRDGVKVPEPSVSSGALLMALVLLAWRRRAHGRPARTVHENGAARR